MKKYYLSLFVLPLFCLFLSSYSLAQTIKQESEISISRDEMPEPALKLINQFWNEQKKADFYREINSKKISYEVKLVWENHLYSIEFDSTGSLIDVEQLIEFTDIPKALQNTITEQIGEQYSKFKITRVQRQLSSQQEGTEDEQVIQLMLNSSNDSLTVRYELEIDAQNKEELGSFELLFGRNGQLIQKRRIVRRSLDNIW